MLLQSVITEDNCSGNCGISCNIFPGPADVPCIIKDLQNCNLWFWLMLFYFHIVRILRFSLSISNTCAVYLLSSVWESSDQVSSKYVFGYFDVGIFCSWQLHFSSWPPSLLQGGGPSTVGCIQLLVQDIPWHNDKDPHDRFFFLNLWNFCTHNFICHLIAVSFFSHSIPFLFYFIWLIFIIVQLPWKV